MNSGDDDGFQYSHSYCDEQLFSAILLTYILENCLSSIFTTKEKYRASL